MEPLNDEELNHLLRKWEAPPAPIRLERRILARPRSWWRWLFTGTIRIPVPVGFALVALAFFWIYRVNTRTPAPAVVRPRNESVSLADFQPVPHLEPVIVGDRK